MRWQPGHAGMRSRLCAPDGEGAAFDHDAVGIAARQHLVAAMVRLVLDGHALCRRLVADLERRTIAASAAHAGRRCSRADLEQREIVRIVAARKERLVGAAARRCAQPVAVKRGRRFQPTAPGPGGSGRDAVHSPISPST